MSHVNSMFNHLMNHQIIFQSIYIILCSHQQHTEVVISPHPHQHILFLEVFFFNYSYCNEYKVVSPDFDLYFPND